MTEFEDRIAAWANNRRAEPNDDRGFTAEVMRRVRHSYHPVARNPKVRRPLPAPLFASLCLLAGVGKLALVLHLAF
jgi:hypothetical protein